MVPLFTQVCLVPTCSAGMWYSKNKNAGGVVLVPFIKWVQTS